MSLKFVSHSVLLLVQAIGMSWKLSAFAARQLYAQSISSWMAYLVRAGGLYARQFWAFGPYDQSSIVRGSMATRAVVGGISAIKHCA